MNEKRRITLNNYRDGEGSCKCGCGLQLTDDMALTLQAFNAVLARAWGAPIRHIITSGARCLAHNRTLGNSSDTSRHINGTACDGHWEYQHNGAWHRIDSSDVALSAVRSGLWGGVGHLRYAREGSFIVHLDLRPGPAVTW